MLKDKIKYYVRIESNDYRDENGKKPAWVISTDYKLTTSYLNVRLFETKEVANYFAKTRFECLCDSRFTFEIIEVPVSADE